MHSSLVALGQVDGGADAVIEALLEAVGPAGMVAMPTFACNPPFGRRTSATRLGAIPDRFWRRPEAVRSLHPTHSVAAIGLGAEELIRDHDKAPTAYGEGTPYHRLAVGGGKILLLGVDQDRNTTLHTAEAFVRAPYLDDIEAAYVDDDGREITISVAAMAGPHRDFIGLDSLFRERGIMNTAKIGKAVCRLMETGPMLGAALEAIRLDPAAVLCDNPACADCVMQRGRIKAARLAKEDFTLAAVAGDISDDPDEVLETIHGEGISALELTAYEYDRYKGKISIVAIRGGVNDVDAAKLAADLCVPLVVPVINREDFEAAARMNSEECLVLTENRGATSELLRELYGKVENAPRLAFNPASFAAVGEKPFLGVFYRGLLRKQTARFYIDDATFEGAPTLPGRGNGEVKEIISMLRCRSYTGTMTLRSHAKGAPAFREAAAALRRLLDTM
ncbi:MAG: AAC(3) family N-acetyltransferase [Armatimonadota bacterium]